MAFSDINFKTKLIFTNAILLTVTLGIFATYSINKFELDKMQAVKNNERVSGLHAMKSLSWLIENANRLSPDQISQSTDYILAIDHPCAAGKAPEVHLSKAFAPIFESIEKDPLLWSKRLELMESCQQAQKNPENLTSNARVIESLLPFPIPYLLVLYPNKESLRLSMLSMAAFQSTTYSTGFLVVDGKLAWTEDGLNFLRRSLSEIQATSADLLEALAKKERSESPLPTVANFGDGGLLTYSSIRPGWDLARLTYLPAVLATVESSRTRALYLALGMIALSLLIGRLLARNFAHSIQEFITSADRVGRGDFNLKLDESGNDEFSQVRRALNTLSATILKMTEELVQKAKLSFELSTAGEVQRLLLPPKELRILGHRIVGTVSPAEFCGGDWWGFYSLPDKNGQESHMVLMFDVSGHGTGAALISATLRGFIAAIGNQARAHPEFYLDPSSVLEAVSQMLLSSTKGEFVATGVAIVLNPNEQTLTISNAGHPPPYLLHPHDHPDAGKGPIALGESSPLLGAQEGNIRRNLRYDWKVGSRLVLFSDGLIAPPLKQDKSNFRIKDLRKILKDSNRLGASALSRQILSSHPLMKSKSPLSDDLSLVLIEREVDS
ncbi:MAG: SpoIIE family protein phosphatase [Bdellovibrionales bacterium]|nr:SpoIIE family protein phosphatase [Bdellovibrionales bacterium]